MSRLYQNKEIFKFFSDIEKNDELEVMFNNYREDNKLKSEDFFRMGKYLKKLSLEEKQPLKTNISLDINYNFISKEKNKDNKEKNNRITYRLTINSLEKINKFMNLVHQRSNNIIFIMLALKVGEDKDITLIKKEKVQSSFIDYDDLDIRVRKSRELEVSKKELDFLTNLSSEESECISFRFKNRLTYFIKKSFCDIPIELTMIQSHSDINQLKKASQTYELEIEVYTPSKSLKESETKQVIDEIIKIKQVLTQNKVLEMTYTLDEIKTNYKNLVYPKEEREINNLYSMQPISAEVQHLIDKIPNKYCVSSKADGNKYGLYVYKNNVILIDNNFNLKPTNLTVKGLDNTLLEGELIFLPKEQRFIMMIFDCLFYQGKDIREMESFSERLTYIYKFMDESKTKYYQTKEYTDKYDLNKMRSHYYQELKKYYSDLNQQIKSSKEGDIIIYPMFFAFLEGGLPSEVFMFADLIWESCTQDTKIECPYILDGVIFKAMEQKYTANKAEQKLPIYKYKPPQKNSIDVYLIFPRNQETGGFLEIFDNSEENRVLNQSYRVANFYVGDNLGNKEVPVPFMKEQNNFEAFFPIDKGQVRDIEGDVIQDKTVVEISYDNNPDIPHPYRWKILRTRWDKTESVNLHQKKYGNFRDVAFRTWVSIKEAVSWDEIKNLANPDSYEKQLNQLKNRIDTSVINTSRAQDEYYQKIRNLAKLMRDYHNFVKSILIYTICAPKRIMKEEKETRLDVLDIGTGSGEDIMKFYHPRVKNYVGLDIDYDAINSPGDGALARYKVFKGKFPDFPRMTFLHANAGVPLVGEKQKANLGNMKPENVSEIDKIFSKKQSFDIICCNFTLHHFFENEMTLNNFCQNINDTLKNGGYLIFTLMDGNRVMKLLNNNEIYTSSYTDEEGKREKLFEINRNFKDTKELNQTGLGLNVLMTWENTNYATEYLVTPEYLEEIMKKKCNAVLIDSDNFENLYTLNEPFFKDVVQTEDNPKNKAYYERISEYYQNLKGADRESKTYSFLNRYYVFMKQV